ncbi:uncharacterized protein LOC110859590 [Folsomia candida]|nr:uncharacterized protein LOC110859590 [Folsomia candida]
MEQLKFERKPIRSSVTRTINLIESELTKETPDRHTLRCQLEKLEVLLTRINEVDIKILSSMRADGCSEKEYEEESLSIEEYEDKIRNTKVKAEEMFVPSFQLPGGSQSPTNSAAWYDSVGTSLNGESKRRNFKLPKIQLRKFNGDMKDWLSWWSQFKKIHEDDTLADSDKFDYLVQGMVIGSRARDVVDVYPHTEENYPKAIAALQERFGQPKLLKQLYVRELLKMVIQNAKSKEDFQLCKMYDKLESHLKALESLNVSHEQMADFLYPMVESSLPEDLLVAWQRSLFYGHDGSQSNPPQSELDFLLKFLKKEVENEGQRSLAKSGFETDEKKKEAVKQKKTFSRFPKPEYESDYPTGAGLFSGHSTSQCVFCKKSGHQSSVCHKAGNMTLNEKKEVVKKNKLCLVCLKPGHFARDCTCQWNCVACEVKHCKAMCPLRSVVDKSSELEASSSATRTSAVNFNVACRGDVLLKTLVLKACGPKAVTSVRLIYDEGSQLSNCGAATISLIGSKCIGHEWGRNVLFGGGVTDVKKINKYAVDLKSLDGHVKKTLVLREAAKICGSIPRVPAGPWIQALRKKNIWLSDYQDSYVDNPEIEVLIDYWGQLVTGKQVKLRCGLIAVETIFGWTLSGPVPNINTNDTVAMSCISLFHGEASVQCLWNLDSIGIKDPEEHKSKRENEEETKRHFLSTVSRNKEGRYTVTLPWIDGAQKIPDNKLVAEKRLIGTTAKLKANGNYKFYDQIFVDWEKEGIIEAVSEEDNSTLCHYLPHRAVIKEESLTTPVRPVFDASCKVGRNPSLNDCLEKGPNLLELIPSLLLRFRERKLGVISDVRKAFQMIEVAEADRDFLRFLWWKEDVIKLFRHRRVMFGANCSPFLLGAVIELHLESVKEELRPIATVLLKSLYVDNCVTSLDSIEEYEEFRTHATSIMADAKMELRQWERTAVDVPDAKQQLTRVLGLKWDKVQDELFVDIPKVELQLQGKLTKRVILSLVQQIFDPMGYLSPATLVPKLMLQKTWESKKTWDEDLDDTLDIKSEFGEWWRQTSMLAEVKIPRWAFRSELVKSVQFHVFSDASGAAYAAAVFVRVEDQKGVTVQLLQAKARVAPLKKMTIPRLELLGCTIAARLHSSVVEALSMDVVETYFWTDSMTALSWIQRNNEWGTFVGNRVKEICSLTKVENWRHVPGVMNPADLPSRGCNPAQLLKSRWWEGPTWLRGSSETWPSGQAEVNEDEVLKEKKKNMTTVKLVSTSQEAPWYLRRYSSYYMNVRLVALWTRIVKLFAKQNSETGVLKRWELIQAEKTMFRFVQSETLQARDSMIGGLRVEIKDGLICVKTKLQNRQDSVGFRYPVLLPSSYPLVEQLIREEHILNQHAGVQFLMGRIREKCWILQGRRAIKKVVSACVTCRRFTTKKPCVPPASLPEDRVKTAQAFQITGVDLAGPMILRNQTKCWMVLFTCAVYRCVHLELVTSLSTEDFLMALWRFISRRGRPTKIYSDNGTNFVGADNLFRSLNWEKIENQTQVHRIQWQFNPPSAAWWGGWWERLIRSIKDLLKRVLKNRKLTQDQLHTSLCQIEAVINDRPLTYVTEDQEDLIPLTPSMFLREIQDVECPEVEELSGHQLSEDNKAKKSLREEFRVRFRKEYLSQLVQRGKQEKVHPFQVGDLVLIGDDNKKRLMWDMGRVIELMVGRDGESRVAKVKTMHGHLIRPLQRLFPLEISNPIEVPVVTQEVEKITPVTKIQKNEQAGAFKKSVKVNVPIKTSRFGRLLNEPSRFSASK